MVLAYEQDEGERAFREAARLDPSLAMAWWGIALAVGPNINYPPDKKNTGSPRLPSSVPGDSPRNTRGICSPRSAPPSPSRVVSIFPDKLTRPRGTRRLSGGGLYASDALAQAQAFAKADGCILTTN